MKYGVAYTSNGSHPSGRGVKIIRWLQHDGQDLVFDTRAEALAACERNGWRGYTAEYPSGKTPWISNY